MNKKPILLISVIFFLLCFFQSGAKKYFTLNRDKITPGNGEISKEIIFSDNNLKITLSPNLKNDSLVNSSTDFSFFVNEKEYSGNSGWELIEKK